MRRATLTVADQSEIFVSQLPKSDLIDDSPPSSEPSRPLLRSVDACSCLAPPARLARQSLAMSQSVSFISSLPALARRPLPSLAIATRISRCTTGPRRASVTVPRMCAKQQVQVGQVVAVETGKSRVDIARITAVSSSGDTVDIILLEPFVKELYVQSKQPSTYERVENVRPITSEYVPSQQGWIVLDQDLQTAKNYFEQRAITGVKQRTVEVTEAPPTPLSEEALKRQVFTPTRSQAFWAAALSVPLSGLCYSAFAAARQTYQANPAGEDLLGGQIFRSLVLFVTSASSVGALVVGSALFLYALSKSDQDEQAT